VEPGSKTISLTNAGVEMTQFRFTKEAAELMNAPLPISKMGDVIQYIDNDDAVSFIKIIDQQAEDWDVTSEAFKYFLEEIVNVVQKEGMSLTDILDENEVNDLITFLTKNK